MGFTNQLTNQLNLRGHLLWLWEEKAKSPSAGLDKSLLSEETLRITPEGIQWVAWLCNKGRDGYGSSCLWFPMIHTIWMARWSRNLMKSQLFRDGKITASSPEMSRIFAKVVVMCTAPVAASWGTKMSECDRGAFQTISIQGPVHSCWISASNGIWVGVQLWRRGAVTPQAPIPPGHDKVQLRVSNSTLGTEDLWAKNGSEGALSARWWWWWWYPPMLPCVAEDLKRQVVCHPRISILCIDVGSNMLIASANMNNEQSLCECHREQGLSICQESVDCCQVGPPTSVGF